MFVLLKFAWIALILLFIGCVLIWPLVTWLVDLGLDVKDEFRKEDK